MKLSYFVLWRQLMNVAIRQMKFVTAEDRVGYKPNSFI
jgi:hypothetical protein